MKVRFHQRLQMPLDDPLRHAVSNRGDATGLPRGESRWFLPSPTSGWLDATGLPRGESRSFLPGESDSLLL